MDSAQRFFQNLMASPSNAAFASSTRKSSRFDGNSPEEIKNELSDEEEQEDDKRSPSAKIETSSNGLKGRLKISLNNARYGITAKRKPKFNDKCPIFMFGTAYESNSLDSNNVHNKKLIPLNFDKKNGGNAPLIVEHSVVDVGGGVQTFDKFVHDYKNLIWFTYRKGFQTLPGTKLDSDCGWGCMLRCGQMMLARAGICHASKSDAVDEDSLRRRVVKNFLDTSQAPFSLHKLVELGDERGKRAGDWFGPASTAYLLKRAIESASLGPTFRNCLFDNFSVYVSNDGVVCVNEIELACSGRRRSDATFAPSSPVFGRMSPLGGQWTPLGGRGSPSLGGRVSPSLGCRGSPVGGRRSPAKVPTVDESRPWTNSLLLLIPLHLGADRLNPLYVHHLKVVLSLKSCVGVLGGKPKRSVYLIGYHDDSLIYLDPHFCQNALVEPESSTFSLKTFSCPDAPRKMPFVDMDPSCAVGFYLKDRTEFTQFLADVSQVAEFGCAPTNYPLFTVVHSREDMQIKKANSFGSLSEFESRSRGNSVSNGGVGKPRLNSFGSSKGYVML